MCNVTFRPGLDFMPRLLVDMMASSLPMILCVVMTSIIYFRAVVNVKKLPEPHFQKINSGIHKLLWYPAVLFLVFLPSLVDHFVLVIDPTDAPSLIFLVPHVAITHSIGFINALIYGIQKKTSEHKRSETIESLNGGSKRVDMTKLSALSASGSKENAISLNNSYIL